MAVLIARTNNRDFTFKRKKSAAIFTPMTGVWEALQGQQKSVKADDGFDCEREGSVATPGAGMPEGR